MQGKLLEPGKVSVAEVEKIYEAVKVANAAEDIVKSAKKTIKEVNEDSTFFVFDKGYASFRIKEKIGFSW